MNGALVLIADDEPSIRETVGFILEMEGFRIAMAEDGEQALEKASRLRPAVVLLDAMMPRRDGFDVCRTIKADASLAATHIVMLTAMGQKRDRDRAFDAGADFFITKPFDEAELVSLLRRLTAPQGGGPA